MLSLDPKDLFEEFQNSSDFVKRHICDIRERTKQLTGEGYEPDEVGAAMDSSLINHQAAWLSMMLPKMVYQNPKAAVNGGRSLADEARTTKLFLDMWVKHIDLASELKFVARDYGMYWGLTYTSIENDPGLTASRENEETVLPITERVPMQRLIIDPACEDWRKARYIGHVWYADKEDLVKIAEEAGEDDGWNLDEIKAMTEDTGGRIDHREDNGIPDRDEVVCVTLWIPEKQIDPDLGPSEGFHGTIVSFAVDRGGENSRLIREPTPYFGPDIGPYDLYGYMTVPGSPIPLSALTLTTGQEKVLSDMSREANHGAKSYRKVVLVPAGTSAAEAAELAAVGKNLIIEVPGMMQDAKPIEIELGGVTDQQLKNLAFAERQLGMLSGMDNAQQGEVTGDGTATEHAIADASTQTRTGGMVDQFMVGPNRAMYRAAWYLWNDERIAVPVSPDDVGAGTEEYGIPWIEGGSDEADRIKFMLLSINVEAMSMERVTEAVQQRRIMQAFNILIQVVPLMRQFPEWDWRRLLGMMGDTMNLPDIGDLVDTDMLQQMIGMQMNLAATNEERSGAGAPNIAGLVQQFGQGEQRELAGNIAGGAMGAGV